MLIKCNNIRTKNWSIKIFEHKIQTDGYNCGVHIVQYIEQIINNKSLNEGSKMNIYWQYLGSPCGSAQQ